MKYEAKKIGDTWCVAIDDGQFKHSDGGHVWGCDDEQQAIYLAEVFNDELSALHGRIIELQSSEDSCIARLEAELERVRGEREAWIGGMLAVGAMRWQPHRAEFCLDIRDIEGIRDERERNAVKAAIAKVHRGCFRDHSDAALSARQNNDAVNAAGGE